jgi:drug/metabolite transporter (DMT)-like permease
MLLRTSASLPSLHRLSSIPGAFDRQIAFLLVLLGAVLFAASNSLVKSVGSRYDVLLIFFWRGLSGLAVAATIAAPSGLTILRVRNWPAHVVRASCGIAATLCSFWTISRLSLGSATALVFAWPLFLQLVARLCLGEPLSAKSGVLAVIGFCGVVLVSGLDIHGSPIAALAGIASALLFACAYAATKVMTSTEHPVTINFYFHLSCVAAGACLAVARWEWPRPFDVLSLVAIGVFGSLAQYLVAAALRLRPASELAPFDYSSVAMSVVAGWLLWGETPRTLNLLGIALIVGTGVILASSNPTLTLTTEDEPSNRGRC